MQARLMRLPPSSPLAGWGALLTLACLLQASLPAHSLVAHGAPLRRPLVPSRSPPPRRAAAIRAGPPPGFGDRGDFAARRPSVSPRVASKVKRNLAFATRTRQALSTLLRVGLPTVIATVIGFVYFDNISLMIRSTLDVGTINILQEDNAQFIQNFLTVVGLLFSILAGNAYSALYQQQESIYFALFQEVSEAKSLVEQTTLVCQGRPFYQSALACMRDYVKNDLRRLDIPPAKLLSSRPAEDPLESIM